MSLGDLTPTAPHLPCGSMGRGEMLPTGSGRWESCPGGGKIVTAAFAPTSCRTQESGASTLLGQHSRLDTVYKGIGESFLKF